MNKVKTNLFALTAGVLISPALMAADLDGPSVERTYSNELLSTAAATDIVAGDVLSIMLEAEYTDDDVLTFSFSGAALDPLTVPASALIAPGTLPGGNGSGVTLGLLSATSDSAIYRVTEVPACDDVAVPGCNNTTVGVTIPIAIADALEFDAQAVDAANVITVNYSAATETGIPLDTGGGDARSIAYIQTDDQYAATVDVEFNQIVDVDTDRKEFVMGIDDQSDITLTNTIAPPFGAAAVDFGAVWEGDFSWIIDTDDVADGIQPGVGVVFSDCVTDLAITATSITHTCSGGVGGEKPLGSGSTLLKLDPSAQGNTETLPQTTYTVTVTANFTGFSGTAGTADFSAGAGRWTLNGFQGLIPYMPYGTGIGQVIYLVNRGSQSGDVTVDYTDQNGNQDSLGVVATLPATSTLKLGQLIQNALPAALKNGGRLGLTITANVPAADVQMNAQYNASGNRAFSLHEDNRPESNPDP